MAELTTLEEKDGRGRGNRRHPSAAEAGEVGHWAVLGKLNETAGENEISELVGWALPIQERHFTDVKDGSLKLAGDKDPYEES